MTMPIVVIMSAEMPDLRMLLPIGLTAASTWLRRRPSNIWLLEC